MKTMLQSLNPSKEWTTKERNKIIEELEYQIHDLQERIFLLRHYDSSFLESNRKAILEGKIRMEDNSIQDGI